MHRKLTATALALVVAGGVYLTAGTAEASNMGFKLERQFRFDPSVRNLFIVSFPLYNGVGNVGNEDTGANGGVACANQLADPTAFVGDVDGNGEPLITMTDIICDLWTDVGDAGNGSFTLQWINPANCGFTPFTVQVNTVFGTSVIGAGQVADDLREFGFLASVAQDNPTTNQAIIVGSHDPGFPGHAMPTPSNCTRDVLSVPYHTMLKNADEILCGLEGMYWSDVNGDGQVQVDGSEWIDVDSDGTPDPCPGGIWDPASGSQVSIQRFDNAAQAFQPRSFNETAFGFTISGPGFDIIPGEGFIVSITSPGLRGDYNPPTFLSPHF